MSFSAAISSYFLHKIIATLSESGIMVLKYFIFTIVIGSLPFASQYLIYPLLMLFGATFGLGFPNMQYWILKISDNNNRASMTSAHRAVSQIGQTIGPIFFGYFAAKYASSNSVEEIFILGTIISLITLFITFFMLKQNILITKGDF
jgi:predicted MFS family arabinose efflux permease